MRGWRAWLTGVLVAAAVLAVGATAVRKQVRDGNDFPLYWQGARDLLQDRSPYDVASGLHGYVYLPWFAWALAPLARLPLPLAATAWYGVNLLLFAVALRELVAALRAAGLAPRPRVLLVATLPLAGLVHDNLVLGQANLLLLALLALAVRGAVTAGTAGAHDGRRGLALGLAAALKMSAGVVALPLLLRARARPLLAAATAAALALLVPLALSGPSEGLRHLADWHAKVVAPAAAGTLQGSKVIDQSPQAAMRRLLVAEPAFADTRVNLVSLEPAAAARAGRALALLLLAAHVFVWVAAPARREPCGLLVDLSLAACAVVQLTGFHLKAQFVVLLLPAWTAATLVAGPGADRAARWLLVAAAALFLASQPGVSGRALSNLLLAWSAMTVGTLLLAAALVRLRWRVPAGA